MRNLISAVTLIAWFLGVVGTHAIGWFVQVLLVAAVVWGVVGFLRLHVAVACQRADRLLDLP